MDCLKVPPRRDDGVGRQAIVRYNLCACLVRALYGTVVVFSNVNVNLGSVSISICLPKDDDDSLRGGVVVAVRANSRTFSWFNHVRNVRWCRLLPLYRENDQEGRCLGVVFVVLGLLGRHAPRERIIVAFRVDCGSPTYILKVGLVNNAGMEKDRVIT